MQILKLKQRKVNNGNETNDHKIVSTLIPLSDREILGDSLVQAGHISEEQLNAAWEASIAGGKRLAEVLVEQKLVPARIVSKAMKAHLQTMPTLEEKGTPEEKRNVLLKFRPPVYTELEIEQKVYPDSIRQDLSTEVLYTAIVTNTKRAVAKNVALSLVNLPPWFKASKVLLDGKPMPDLNGGLTALQIGDIAPGESKWVVIAGTASP